MARTCGNRCVSSSGSELCQTRVGGNGKITRDVVLAAALEIIDRDGTDALSMRRLARALNRDPMILYRHAPNKAALLDGVAETVLAQLHVDSADPDWAGQLRAVARRYRALALAHPHAVPLIVTRPLATPLALRPLGALRPLEDILALLTRAGFSGPRKVISPGRHLAVSPPRRATDEPTGRPAGTIQIFPNLFKASSKITVPLGVFKGVGQIAAKFRHLVPGCWARRERRQLAREPQGTRTVRRQAQG